MKKVARNNCGPPFSFIVKAGQAYSLVADDEFE